MIWWFFLDDDIDDVKDDPNAITSRVVIDRSLFVSNRSFVSQQQSWCQILKKFLKVPVQ